MMQVMPEHDHLGLQNILSENRHDVGGVQMRVNNVDFMPITELNQLKKSDQECNRKRLSF
jgi:hypothetical protein